MMSVLELERSYDKCGDNRCSDQDNNCGCRAWAQERADLDFFVGDWVKIGPDGPDMMAGMRFRILGFVYHKPTMRGLVVLDVLLQPVDRHEYDLRRVT